MVWGGAGRGSSGTSTRLARPAHAAPPGAVGHTHDVAWHHSFAGWSDLLIDGILHPAREGRAVRCRPPARDQRVRDGALEVPTGTRWLFVEGTGGSPRSCGSWTSTGPGSTPTSSSPASASPALVTIEP